MDLNSVTSAAFTRIAEAGLSPKVIATWDPELSRDPRLLVPVDVRAMVVAPDEEVEHADVATTLLAASEPPGRAAPDPFTEGGKRAPGVYLHWALPDALTRGTGDETAGVQMRPLPDRWLVARLEPGTRRAVKAWVIESERGFREPLQQWPSGAASVAPPLSSEELTAMAGGDPAWAAAWDNVVDRFAMYDDLDGRFELRDLAYLVAGWYSKPELDPLHPAAEHPPFDELLPRLGWELDRRSLARLAAERRRHQEAAERAGLEAAPAGIAGTAAELEPEPHPERRAEPEVAGLGAGVESARLERSETRAVPFAGAPAKLSEGGRRLALALTPWSPTQSLYHGAVHGVTIGPEARLDPRPEPGEVRLTAGATGTEALARLLAAVLPGGDDVLEERLQTAFAYGLTARFEEPDGVSALEEELHARAFGSEPAGYVVERVRSGDPLAAVRAGAAQAAAAEQRRLHRLAEIAREAKESVRFEWLGVDRARLIDVLDLKTRPERVLPREQPVTYETVRRAAPRFFFPQDPVLCLEGLERSLRHGHDGIHTPAGKLACRLSGDEVTALAGVIDGSELLAERLDHGGIPPELEQLLAETALTDHTAADEISKLAAALRGLPDEAVRTRVVAEARLRLRAAQAGSDAPRLLSLSVADGVLPSPVAVTPFRQAWVPLYLEWRLELDVDDRLDRWTLGELDYSPGPDGAAGAESVEVDGRALLTASATKAFADQVSEFLAEEDRLDQARQGVVGPDDQKLLRAISQLAGSLDVLAGGLDGLRERLLGFDENVGRDEELPEPTTLPRLLRGGTARLVRLRVVDAFGRTLEVPAEQLAELDLGEGLRGPAGKPGELHLPPRITSRARLQFRLLDSGDDEVEVRIDQENPAAAGNPVCAWLLPDHVDDALEFFDPAGEPQGQLRHDLLTGGVVWEGAPGVPGPVGVGPPDAMNPHAAALATALVQRDAADRDSRGARSESPLSALLRVIDTTLWTVDPFGATGREYFASLTGRPIAVVRCSLLLEAPSDTVDFPRLETPDREARDAAFRELAARSFDVRLGALTRFDDGLLGYFVDDDYTRFFPVHAKVPEEALPAGPHTGFLERADATPAETGALEPRPIEQPWIVRDPTVGVRPGRRVLLTLLMDPGGKVHATSGIVPRKSIGLLRDWTAGALARIAPSFRIGPVLVDPRTIRLPVVSALPKRQSWTRRDTPTTWRDDPIIAATQEATFPDQAAAAQEGYIRARIEDNAD